MTVKIDEAANKWCDAPFSLNGDKSGQPTRIRNRKAPDFKVLFWWHRRSWSQKIWGILKCTMTLQCSWTAKISRLTSRSSILKSSNQKSSTEEEIQEATASLAAPKEISLDAPASKLDGIFTFKEQRTPLKAFFFFLVKRCFCMFSGVLS